MRRNSSTLSAMSVAAAAVFSGPSKRARVIAGLLAAEISEIIENSTSRDFVGELYIYQSHLAAGHRVSIPSILSLNAIEAPVFGHLIREVGLLGVRDASGVVAFHASFRRLCHDLALISMDEFSPAETLAAWLEHDIQLLSNMEASGMRLLNRLNTIAHVRPMATHGLGRWS